jgi:hypothetical protein
MAFWKLHTITGAVVARVLVDRTSAPSEGFTPITDEVLEQQIRRMGETIEKLPSQNGIETGKAMSQEELDELERQLISVSLKLTDAWLLGNMTPKQRERVAAINYRDQLKRYQLGWYHPTASEFYSEMTNQDYKENAEDWLTEEKMWGSDLRDLVSA